MKKFQAYNLGQIKKAEIELGDFTVFVGPQASGKSILLQMMKLGVDWFDIKDTIKRYGFDWNGDFREFLQLYLGEGTAGVLSDQTSLKVDNKDISVEKFLKAKKGKAESLFYIPAQRVMSIYNGWPKNFLSFEIGDPFVVKKFSEDLRQLMEAGLGTGNDGSIFPKSGRMKKPFRDKINQSIFYDATVELDKKSPKRRIMLQVGSEMLPYMAWSSGQREFMPLLLGLYWLMPSQTLQKRNNIQYVVIEEPEMGLHPMAIQSLLLTFLELIQRGYKVIISTHSPVVLELCWAIRLMQELKAKEDAMFDLFQIKQKQKGIKDIFSHILQEASFKTYYFDAGNEGFNVLDISELDPGTDDPNIADWGGLTSFGTRASEIIANIINQKNGF